MRLIAIDPGASGGLTLAERNPETGLWRHEAAKMPDTNAEIAQWLKERVIPGTIVYLEKVGTSRPGNSARAITTFARHCGFLDGVLIMLPCVINEVLPNTWMKKLIPTLHKDKKERKAQLKAYAQKQFPEFRVTNYTGDALAFLIFAKKREFYHE